MTMVSTVVILSLSFFAAFMLIFCINLILTELSLQEKKEQRFQLLAQTREQQREAVRQSPLMQRAINELEEGVFEEEAGRKRSLVRRFCTIVEQSGLGVSPQRVAALSVCVMLVAVGVTAFYSGSVLIAVIVGAGVGALPIVYVNYCREKRTEKLRSQLPDTFDLMGRILRAGQTLPQAMQTVAQESPAPVSIEFGFCYEQQNLGLNPEFALKDLARRTGLLEIQIFVIAVLVHRQSGGNLTEILDSLAKIVRGRYRLRAKIESLTMEGKIQAYVLLALPFGVYAILLVTNYTYAIKLFDHPILPIGTMISMAFGALWMRKIINFDY